VPEIPQDVPAADRFLRQGIPVPDADISKYRQRLGSLLRQSRRSIEPPTSQKDVAEALGIAQSAVSDWERGESWPSVFSLLALVRLLGIDPAELLEVIDDDRPNGDEGQAA
jgi:transcriptional regulator with XRE-family HTH domain